MKSLSGINIPERLTDPSPPLEGIEIYSKNGLIYSIDSTGLIEVLTNTQSGGNGGSNDHVDISLDAGEVILANTVLTTNESGHVVTASSSNLLHVNKILGVSRNAGQVGHVIRTRVSGILTNTSWNFPPNSPLYLGINGEVTSDPNSGLFMNQIGHSLTETTIYINVGRSIVRG